MAGDKHHLQIRASEQVRAKIDKLARAHHRSTADIVRSSLDLGLRLLEKLLDAQSEMVAEYIALLKKDARLKKHN
jgi:hypothetical protein